MFTWFAGLLVGWCAGLLIIIGHYPGTGNQGRPSSDLHDPRTAGGNPCNLGQPLGLVLVKGLIYNMYFICASGTCAAQVASR